MRVERIESFYSKLSETENSLKVMMSVKFSIRNNIIRSVTASVNAMGKYLSLKFSGSSFIYSLKHRTIQSYTLRMGFNVRVTNTLIGEEDILKIYRQKDMVEKAFMHSKYVSWNLCMHIQMKEHGQRCFSPFSGI